jgi:hypothetical protein
MTSTPADPTGPSAMERQGALLQDLARLALDTIDWPAAWDRAAIAFIPDGEGWAGRVTIEPPEGDALTADARFAADSQFTLLLDGLQQATAEQSEAFVSLLLKIGRNPADPSAISLGTEFNYDLDPGSFDGVGGVDRAVAQRMADRLGAGRIPQWVRDLLG